MNLVNLVIATGYLKQTLFGVSFVRYIIRLNRQKQAANFSIVHDSGLSEKLEIIQCQWCNSLSSSIEGGI